MLHMASTQPSVLFATFEAAPFVKTGGLGDVGGTLPAALQAAGAEVRVILPKFATIPQQYRDAMTHVADFRLYLGWRNQFCGIEQLVHNGVTFYFVDNEYYFGRSYPYGFFDDGERIAFFAKAICECIRYLDFVPNILHCNDWHTALSPVYLRELFQDQEVYRDIKTVFTVHNLKFQGMYDGSMLMDVVDLGWSEAARNQLMQGDAINFMRGALNYSDRLTTVSPTYAQEVCTDFYGEGLNDVYNRRHEVLSGILNGIDTAQYDPANDPNLPVPFDKDHVAGKTENKTRLQQELGLTVDADIPMIGIISRLTDQKGLDLVNAILPDLLQDDVQLVVLGVGQQEYEDTFRFFAARFPEKVSANIRFSDPMSHKIYAACDMVLVPSLFEPCGLSQMIAMRYGTLPVVRETGGLKDSVQPYNQYTGAGNGFSFANYNAHELLDTIRRAVDLYRTGRPAWDALVQNAFAADFSWKTSAAKYLALYEDLLAE
jgi:starch synthase